MNVTPLVTFAPATLVVRTTIEPDAQNRAVEMVAELGVRGEGLGVEVRGQRFLTPDP